jgi:predicted ribosome quality control (RQC) complex YloA/Tae2 family protein
MRSKYKSRINGRPFEYFENKIISYRFEEFYDKVLTRMTIKKTDNPYQEFEEIIKEEINQVEDQFKRLDQELENGT